MEQQGLRRSALIVLAAVWMGLAGAWAEQPKSGGTLRVAFEADATGFDPAVPGLQNYYVNQNLFNTLVTLDEHLGFVPDLAESWEIQEQGSDRWRRTLDLQEQRKIAEAVQHYVADSALYTAVCGNPIVNTHRSDVRGYTYMRGLLVMFERTWLDRP